MKKLWGCVGVLALAVVLGAVSGDEPKPKVKGQLPANWKKLNLNSTQKERIYEIRAGYKKQISDLRAQIRGLQKKEMSEMVAVLTKEQKARLAEGLTDEPKEKKS